MTTNEHQKNWYDKSYKDGVYKIYVEEENIRRKVNQRRFQDISKYISNGTHLDVGCSTGYFLDVSSDKGFLTYGVELSEESVKKINPKHKNIFQGTLENSNFSNNFFDLVTMYDFIEHVIDPNLTIKIASEKIKSDGIFVLTTPDITSWHAKLMGWLNRNYLSNGSYFANDEELQDEMLLCGATSKIAGALLDRVESNQ